VSIGGIESRSGRAGIQNAIDTRRRQRTANIGLGNGIGVPPIEECVRRTNSDALADSKRSADLTAGSERVCAREKGLGNICCRNFAEDELHPCDAYILQK